MRPFDFGSIRVEKYTSTRFDSNYVNGSHSVFRRTTYIHTYINHHINTLSHCLRLSGGSIFLSLLCRINSELLFFFEYSNSSLIALGQCLLLLHVYAKHLALCSGDKSSERFGSVISQLN